MINITLICVGKLKEAWLKQASAEYEKRLSPSCSFAIREIPEEKLCDSPSDAQISAALDKEAAKILACIPDSAYVTAMCIEGKKLSSVELSQMIERLSVSGKSKLIFIIGGSFGLSELIKRRADLRISMSDMTFPHHLARIMLEEQLYRAFSISDGKKYHK